MAERVAQARFVSVDLQETEDNRALIEFQIRRVEGGKATDGWIFATLAVGDEVALSGPYGRFVLKVGGDAPAIMIAGGTGLAPIASMIKHALVNGEYGGHITLYAGGRSKEWLYDVDVFRQLEADYPDQFTYRPRLSESCEDGDAEGEPTGWIASVLGAIVLLLIAGLMRRGSS